MMSRKKKSEQITRRSTLLSHVKSTMIYEKEPTSLYDLLSSSSSYRLQMKSDIQQAEQCFDEASATVIVLSCSSASFDIQHTTVFDLLSSSSVNGQDIHQCCYEKSEATGDARSVSKFDVREKEPTTAVTTTIGDVRSVSKFDVQDIQYREKEPTMAVTTTINDVR